MLLLMNAPLMHLLNCSRYAHAMGELSSDAERRIEPELCAALEKVGFAADAPNATPLADYARKKSAFLLFGLLAHCLATNGEEGPSLSMCSQPSPGESPTPWTCTHS